MIENHPKNMLIIGDFNLPSIDWVNKTANGKGQPLLELCEDLFLTQSIQFPTHQRGNTRFSTSCVDNSELHSYTQKRYKV